MAADAILLAGGPGSDELVVNRNSAFMRGGPGSDLMRAVGPARDNPPEPIPCVLYGGVARPVSVNLVNRTAPGEGRDQIAGIRCATGTRFADVFVGSDSADDFATGAGADRVDTHAGRDLVNAGVGADTVNLGPGNDSAHGDAGNDRILGQAGRDGILGWDDSDFLSGGPNDDSVRAGGCCDEASAADGTLDQAPNTVFGGDGDDIVSGDLGDDQSTAAQDATANQAAQQDAEPT